ncbi:alpha-amlyase [Peribacillus cavernae]|uniref:alpha-amylase n=1 Tax=Peribacillus cavernae TaxID=1674310 RepID=A0A3S0W8M2_9BACI|nr:alpha-amylase family glycosyl hydrolase [Peribacillus cavernae]MDQ0217561.1 alpha-amylase [Peribacillus cavernae]RUQ30005.1 alpha-amlyase [Peribacillus cavernae]
MKTRVLPLVLIPFLLFYALPAGAVEKEERKWQDEVIYSLMVDRFNDGDIKNNKDVDVNDPAAYNGGDFKGITDKLDYIKDMGFTAISLTPVFDNEDKGYHGYWIKDYYKTDEHFGTIADFKKLVKEAHKRDLKVITEFAANQVGPHHPWLKDPEKKDWFHEEKTISDNKNSGNIETGWINGLPDLNQENPETKAYLLDAAKWWIKETNIDGYSLDMVNYVPKAFWADFSKAVNSEKPDFYLLGEVVGDNTEAIADYKKTGIDGFLDVPLNEDLRTAFKDTDQSMDPLFSDFTRNKDQFENPELMGNFIDNHQMTRFTNEAVLLKHHPGTRWKMALSYIYTVPGIPIVYYGSEIAMNGGKEPENRKLMAFKAEKELIDYITKLAELRQQLPSLTRGDFKLLYENGGMAVFKRTYKDETVIVAINNTSKSQTVTLKKGEIEENQELRGLLTDDLVRSKEDKYTIILDREKTEIYALADKSGLNVTYMSIMGVVYAAFIAFIILIFKRARRKKTD